MPTRNTFSSALTPRCYSPEDWMCMFGNNKFINKRHLVSIELSFSHRLVLIWRFVHRQAWGVQLNGSISIRLALLV